MMAWWLFVVVQNGQSLQWQVIQAALIWQSWGLTFTFGWVYMHEDEKSVVENVREIRSGSCKQWVT